MRFSVIIPVYNAERYICECVQSIMNQTCQSYEIVLVDDGSTDSSGKICDKFVRDCPEKIRVIHQENQGQLLTRCNGIRASKGDYCVFLDSDDLLESNALEIIEKTIVRRENPDMIIYSFYYESVNGEKTKAVPLFTNEKVFDGEEQKKKLYEKFFTGTGLNNVWTKAVRRTVFEREFPDYNQYAKVRCSEDRLHAMGMVTNSQKIVYIDEPLYVYKLIPNSISRTFTVDSISRFNIKVLYQEELEYLKKWGLSLPEWKNRLDASWILQTWYVFDMYYNNLRSKSMRNQVLTYDWSDFLPDTVLEAYDSNPYLNQHQKQCWGWLIQKNYYRLRYYLLKKNIRSNIRRLKYKVLKKENSL